MRITLSVLGAKLNKEILPNSRIKIFRKSKIKTIKNDEPIQANENDKISSEYRENEMKIQMLSKSLYDQIFKTTSDKLKPTLIKQ